MLNWGCTTQTVLNSVTLQQRKALRIMSFKDDLFPHNQLFSNFKILELEKCHKLSLSKLYWKLRNNFLPECINDILLPPRSANLPDRTTNDVHNFVPKYRTLVKARFVTNVAPQLWGQIPKEIKEKTTLKSFSYHLRCLLIDD